MCALLMCMWCVSDSIRAESTALLSLLWKYNQKWFNTLVEFSHCFIGIICWFHSLVSHDESAGVQNLVNLCGLGA